jgi:hypothetical protein
LDRGLFQKQVAQQGGVQETTVYNRERNAPGPPSRNVPPLNSLLDEPIYLIGRPRRIQVAQPRWDAGIQRVVTATADVGRSTGFRKRDILLYAWVKRKIPIR